MTRYLLWLFVLAFAGCAVTPSPDSPHTRVPVGSRLVLTQPLTIPPRAVATYIQDGRALNYGAVDRYYPHCKFELYDLADERRTVAPDTFTVTRVVRDTLEVQAPTLQRFAAVAGGFAGFGEDGGAPIALENQTILYIESSRQPGVYRLTCNYWDQPFESRHLTINEIRTALGDLIRLENLGEELE